MGKALRVFVVILLLLSIAALVLGILLFNKRELLKGRTKQLEEYVIKIARTLESEEPEEVPDPEDPERDVSPVEAEVLASPDEDDFWDDYKYELEQADQDTMELDTKHNQLMQYYLREPGTGRIVRHEQYGTKMTTGPGTMHELLEDVLKRATEQYNRLNDTRAQLQALREEHIATIRELNQLKNDLRGRLKVIEDLRAEIARLQQRIADLEQQVALLEEEKRNLQDEIREKDRIIEERDDTIASKNLEIKQLEAEVDRLRRGTDTIDQPGTREARYIEPGTKGAVEAVNMEWNFVVLKLSPEFVNKLVGEDRNQPMPDVELMLRRPGTIKQDEFVTKVRLKQLKADEGLGVADILVEWQQKPVQVGDVAFY